MRRGGYRADPRSAAAMRNTESLVQVQMADIGADFRRAAYSDLCIHVRAIHVNLSAVGMNDPANLLDGFFEDAVRRRIRDHEARPVHAYAAPLYS